MRNSRKTRSTSLQKPLENYATQFNYGVYQCPIQSEWIWRIDADEFLEGNIGTAVKMR